LVDWGKSGNLYHLLWFNEAHTTIGSFVPSNLMLSTRMLPEASSERGKLWLLAIPYELTCYARSRQAEQFIPELGQQALSSAASKPIVANSDEDGNSTMTQEYPVDREKVEARKPIHPGVIFGEDVMPELRRNRTIGEIATLLGISRQTLHRVMAGEMAISPDMAARLGKLVGNGARIWFAMQADYDAWEATHRLSRELKKIPTLA
jgi:addiction module HigA family antidote